MKCVLKRITNEGSPKPRRGRQERWQEPGWASRTRWCLSGRLARSDTRCDRAARWASGSLGKSRWRGCPPRFIGQTELKTQQLLSESGVKSCVNEKRITKGNFLITSFFFFFAVPGCYTHRSDETAICSRWKDLLFQSHIPTAETLTWDLVYRTQHQYLHVSVPWSYLDKHFQNLLLLTMLQLMLEMHDQTVFYIPSTNK